MYKSLIVVFTLLLNNLIISQNHNPGELNIPERPADAIGGYEFMNSIKDMSFSNRENAIKNEFLSGNVPNFMRQLIQIETTFNDLNGNPHTVKFWVMPNYLAIGSDSNFCSSA